MRFLGLYNYELKINNQPLTRSFPSSLCFASCSKSHVPAKRTGRGICGKDGKRAFCPELEGVPFPMVWVAWHSLPGVFSLFLCKERVKWGAWVADEVGRALRLAGFITFGRCTVWCGFISYLQSLSRNLGSVLQWVLPVSLYILKKESSSVQKKGRKFKRQILKENRGPRWKQWNQTG